MRLSEAIRLGAMMKPQKRFGDADGLGSCALLAAADAVGLQPVGGTVNYAAIERSWPILNKRVNAPVGCYWIRVLEVIYTLNDSHKWTREAIADWVESIENTLGGVEAATKTTTAQTL